VSAATIIIQHARCIPAVKLPSVASLAPQNFFSHYLINGTIFGKIKERKIYVLFFSTFLPEIFPILRRIHWDNVINVLRSSYIVTLFLSHLNGILTFSKEFLKNSQISNFMKIRAVVVELFKQKDGETEVTKLIVAFRSLVTPQLHTRFLLVPRRKHTSSPLQETLIWCYVAKLWLHVLRRIL
jgi:hypothetical protein